ncbi:hypothetical protein EMCRGX_G021856 [Ephydatia muelleri]
MKACGFFRVGVYCVECSGPGLSEAIFTRNRNFLWLISSRNWNLLCTWSPLWVPNRNLFSTASIVHCI